MKSEEWAYLHTVITYASHRMLSPSRTAACRHSRGPALLLQYSSANPLVCVICA